MRSVTLLAMGALAGLGFFSSPYGKDVKGSAGGGGFAVLELFTSEGCSSCPDADALLARVQKEAGDKPVYVLSYHVDYWDRLGWKDIFSSPQYSKRQYFYSGHLGSQVYTPQLVVNGRSECIGSDASKVSGLLETALHTAGSVSLNMRGLQRSSEMDLSYQVTGNTNSSQLVIGVVQKQAVSVVKRGENAGRTLSHAQIVQKLYEFDLPSGKKGTEHFVLPAGFSADGWEVIGFIQDKESGAITAAGRVLLSI